MIMKEYTYIVVDWNGRDYFQVEAPIRNYHVAHAKDSYEALRRVLQLEGVILRAYVNQFGTERVVGGGGYVSYYYKVVY
jgi:hypothetical protein